MMLFVQLIMGGMAFAADPPKAEYDAAIAAIPSGAYYITTEVDGVKYYVTASGDLEERYEGIDASEGLFTINQDEGGALYNVGWHIEGANGHFSNTTLSGDKAVLNYGSFRLDGGQNRHDWESQVFFMNEEGKITIRSCNTGYGESSWADAGRAFWTYQVDEVGEVIWGDYGPLPGYSYEPAYIWTLEVPTGPEEVKMILNEIVNKYDSYDQDYDGYGLGLGLGFGTDYGQYTDSETWQQLLELFEKIYYDILPKMMDESYDYYSDPDAVTKEEAQAMAADLDSLFQKVLDSEVPYMMPKDGGYYRIYAVKRYASTFDESGFVDKAIAASYEDVHKGKAVLGTVKKNLASYLWKLTRSESGDSVMIQNAGMGTYISFSSDVTENKVFLTDDPTDASCVMFDYAGLEYVEPDGVPYDDKDIFAIRLAGTKRGKDGRYIHQMNHSSYDADSSPWFSYGKDLGSDQELGFWIRTFDNDRTTDKFCSEWFLEYVPDAEAEEIIADFDMIMNHDVLVAKNNALREEVAAAIETAKDAIKTPRITSVDQLDNRFGDPSEGQNIGNLIDGNASTFWHTTWHGLAEGVEAMDYYTGEIDPEDGSDVVLACHYVQISDMQDLVGNCEMYWRERDGADNDRPTKVALYGSDDPEAEDEAWVQIAVLDIPNSGKGEENSISFTMETGYQNIRILAVAVNSSFRSFWHAAEIQLYTVEDNPNSQFAALGEIAEELESVYEANVATADEDITPEVYQALLDAFKAFNAGMVDPTELRNALAAYANVTKGVVEGTNPGEWTSTAIAEEFDKLLAEATAYDKAGRYTAEQSHKYAVMLKAMQKSVMEQANVVQTDKWYRIMVPTEEMYDAFDFSKEGVDKCQDLIEDQWSICGNFVTAAKLESEEGTEIDDETGEEKTVTISWLEAIGGEDLRESDRLFFMPDDEMEDKDASMFRFVEQKSDDSDSTPLFQDAKENMAMALDMSTTYTRGEKLITKASQLSSNASDSAEGTNIGNLIDGNPSTFWHSDWHKDVIAPPYLQVAFDEPISGPIQVEVTRRNNDFGHIVRMFIVGSNDGEDWTNIGYMETPYGGTPNEVVSSQPINLDGTYKYLRFINTCRWLNGGGNSTEMDPFAEPKSADEYDVTWTYFHAAEFQIYPVTPDQELTGSAKTLQDAYIVANKVVLKDATAEDLAAAANGYRNYRSEFNAEAGKDVLPYGKDKVDPVYALQNKATGLFVMVSGTGNQNNIYLKTIPTLVGYKALGYERSLLSAKTINGVSCNNFHAGESNRRFCTWSSTEATSNSGLVICEAEEEYAAPEEFTFYKDVKPGRIADWCHSVTLNVLEAPEGASAYTAVGWYTNEENALFLALNAIETIPAGEPALYIYGDTTDYDAEDEYVEPVKFKISGDEKPVLEGTTVNGLMGTLVTYTLKENEIYFNANYAAVGGASVSVTPCSAVLNLKDCPEVDPEGEYDFSICITGDPDQADGIENVAATIEKVSQRGDVYSMDGKLLRRGATLNSLKTLGSGMYILNGVKVIVK